MSQNQGFHSSISYRNIRQESSEGQAAISLRCKPRWHESAVHACGRVLFARLAGLDLVERILFHVV